MSGLAGLLLKGAIKASTKNKSLNKKINPDNIYQDNPDIRGKDRITGKYYTDSKNEYAKEVRKKASPDTYQGTLGTTEGITTFLKKIKLLPEDVINFPGAKKEEDFRNTSEKLKRLQDSIKKKGYKPDPILIHVREDGIPFIVEGNHRAVEAAISKRPFIEADIYYLRGAEQIDGPISLDKILPEKIVKDKIFKVKKAKGGRVERNPYGDYQPRNI